MNARVVCGVERQGFAMRLSAIILALAAAIKVNLAVPTLFSLPGHHPGLILNIDQSRILASDIHGTSSPLQRERSSQLAKRTRNLQIDQMMIHQMVIPIRFASNYLTRFYTKILQDCLTQWIDAQPVPAFSITLGPFVMTLRSSLGPVPWSLVSELAMHMLAVTSMGFTGTYDMWYTDIQGLSVVAVAFRIRPDVMANLSVWMN